MENDSAKYGASTSASHDRTMTVEDIKARIDLVNNQGLDELSATYDSIYSDLHSLFSDIDGM